MKIVVTGALGHIGSSLIRRLPLSFSDVEVVMLDNLSTQRYCSLFNLPSGCKYRFIEGDVLDCDLDGIFRGASVVIHLAAITNAEGSFQIKDQVEKVNVEGTMRVVQACLKAGCSMIFVSTTSVYGTQNEEVDEDCSGAELKPQSPYAESKLKAERYLQEMAGKGLRVAICRFGTIFGASVGMRFHTAINKFCWQAIMGQPITVWRTAMDQVRPYLDLGDAVRALIFITSNKLYNGHIYNVVTVNESVRHITEIISRYVPGLSIQYVDSRIMNQLSYRVSSNRFRDKGFQFSGNLEEGIRATLDLLRNSNEPLARS